MIYIYILACRTPLPEPVQDTGGETIGQQIDDTSFELSIETEPHHWIEMPIEVTSSINATTNAPTETEIVWQYQWTCTDGTTGTEDTLLFTPSTAGIVSCTLTAQSDSGFAINPVTISTEVHAAPEEADWTILVYLAGDNNLEESAIIDLNEMEQVGSTNNINIVVELDRSNGFYSGHDNWTGARRFYVLKDTSSAEVDPDYSEIVSIELDRLGDVDTGNPNTLSDFVTWGVNTFPSDKLAVILWNHGWSWSLQSTTSSTKGIMSDDSTGNDVSVAQGEFEEILQSAVEQRGHKIDILGLDACIMQSWEVAVVSEPYAELLVASQDYVNWDGWAYDQFLRELVDTTNMSSIDLAESINRTFWRSGDSTISTIDLAYLPAFNEKLNALSAGLLQDDSPSIVPIAAQTYSPDGTNGQDHDLFALLNILKRDGQTVSIQNQADQLLDMQLTLVPHNFIGDWVNGANGLSIHAPTSFDWDLEEAYLTSHWADETLWDDVLVHELQQGQDTTTTGR